MQLWRPVGMDEMALIVESGMQSYPPRFPEQPIFYPVLNRPYAEQIARDWNTSERSYAGYVTGFDLPDAYTSQFERHVVGKREHVEFWIPADELETLNQRIVGPIRVLGAYFGAKFRGHVPEAFGLRGRDADEQLLLLSRTRAYSGMDFICEIQANELTIFLNFPYWVASKATDFGLQTEEFEATLEAIRKAWSLSERAASLVEQGERVT